MYSLCFRTPLYAALFDGFKTSLQNVSLYKDWNRMTPKNGETLQKVENFHRVSISSTLNASDILSYFCYRLHTIALAKVLNILLFSKYFSLYFHLLTLIYHSEDIFTPTPC